MNFLVTGQDVERYLTIQRLIYTVLEYKIQISSKKWSEIIAYSEHARVP
jgi:hypothetical protein